MADNVSNPRSFFDYDFQTAATVKDSSQEDETESDYDELNQQVYFERRSKLKPLTEKLRQWQRNIRSSVGRLREFRGPNDEDSRPTSTLSYNSSSFSGGRSSPSLEVVDFIDDEYLAIRHRVRHYHFHLRRVFEHLDSALKRGPPLGGRLDALRSTFKGGPIGQFPEEALAKCFSEFCLDLDGNGKLALSLRDASDAFNFSASLRQALVKTARSGFLAPLTEFLIRDWKEICARDKSLRRLAKKIQKVKSEAKHSQAEINAMMTRFAARRLDVVQNFEFILKSEIPLTKRLINLMEAYKIYYFENTKVFNGLERSLRLHLGKTPPDIISFVENQPDEVESLPEIASSTGAVDSNPRNDTVEKEEPEPTPSKDAGEGQTTEKNSDVGGMTLASLTLTGGGDLNSPAAAAAAKQSIWEAKNLKPIQKTTPPPLLGHRNSSRAYGFVRTAFSASGGDELDLCVGDLVYLDAKLQHEETKEIWVCGEVASGLKRRSGLFPLNVVEVIIDV